MTASINTKPAIGLLRLGPRARDVEEVPIGSVVRTPLGELARVVSHRGGRRSGGGVKDCHERLVCRYLQPRNKRFDLVTLRAELVEIVNEEGCHAA